MEECMDRIWECKGNNNTVDCRIILILRLISIISHSHIHRQCNLSRCFTHHSTRPLLKTLYILKTFRTCKTYRICKPCKPCKTFKTCLWETTNPKPSPALHLWMKTWPDKRFPSHSTPNKCKWTNPFNSNLSGKSKWEHQEAQWSVNNPNKCIKMTQISDWKKKSYCDLLFV